MNRLSAPGWWRDEPERLFVFYLLLFAWLPWFKGATPPWAWPLMVAHVLFLLSYAVKLHLDGMLPMTMALGRAWPVLVLLALWLSWNLAQWIPLPAVLVDLASPMAADIHSQARPDAFWLTLSIDPHATRNEMLKGLAYAGLFMLTLLLVDSPRRIARLGRWLITIALLQALFASLVVLSGLHFLYRSDYAHGTFMNHNQLAGFLELSLAIGIGLMLAGMSQQRIQGWRQHLRHLSETLLSPRIRLRVFLVVLVIALLLTRSRMGNTAFLISLFLTGGLALLMMRHSPRPVVILLTSILAIDVVVASTWFGFEQLKERFTQLESKEVTLQAGKDTIDRLEVAGHALQLHADYRWTGSGHGTFFTAFPAYQTEERLKYWQHAHNDYLEFLTDTGIIGLALLAIVVLIALGTAILAMRRRRSPLMRGMAFASTMGIFSLLIHATTDFNFRVPSNAALFMVILALAFIANSTPHESRH